MPHSNCGTSDTTTPESFEQVDLHKPVKVFATTKEHAGSLSAEIAQMYEVALGPGGLCKSGHEAYPDRDLFSIEGVKATLEAGERLIAVAQVNEGGKDIIVGAMVADRLSPHHVEFNSMAVPAHRRGRKLGSQIVRGLADIIEKDDFTVNCTELVTHSLASQAAHFHNGFNAICGFGLCHYPRVFFKDHPESVIWATRLHGRLVSELKKYRSSLGSGLGKSFLEIRQKILSAEASRQISDTTHCLDYKSVNLLAEILKERVAYVPASYKELVRSILQQFKDILDCNVDNEIIPDLGQSRTLQPGRVIADSLTIDFNEGFGHSYITLKNHFCFDRDALEKAIDAIKNLDKRFIKVCIPANTAEAVKVAHYLMGRGFVFHSYLPLYGYDRQVIDSEEDEKTTETTEFYDILSLQWIKPSVVKANPLPGETDSVIKIYGYPENLSGPILKTIAKELRAIECFGLDTDKEIQQGEYSE